MQAALIDAVVVLGGIGALSGVTLSLVARFFGVKEDPRVEELTGLLPGANCGACGYAGCADYARAVILHGAQVVLCRPGGQETADRVAAFLGVGAATVERVVARVMCSGDDNRAALKFKYNGPADCAQAALVAGGDKVCPYGCLGLGSCARACPEQAIEITAQRLAVVRADRCVGCGLCVAACPRQLIRLVPASARLHIQCSSRDRGPTVKSYCEVGCIGCTLCAKKSGGAIVMDGSLARVDYAQTVENPAELAAVCPRHCIVVSGDSGEEGRSS